MFATIIMNVSVTGNPLDLNLTHFDCLGDYSVAYKVFKAFLWLLLLVLSFIGNILLIMIVFKTRALQSHNSHFMVNIAISDLLVPMFVVPRHLVKLFVGHRWLIDGVPGSILCKFVPFAGDLSIPVSVLTMIVIAVDRFHCVMFPLKQPLISSSRFRKVVASIWGFSALCLSFYFAIFELVQRNGKTYCKATWEMIGCIGNVSEPSKADRDSMHNFIGYFLCFSVAPFVILAALYTGIVIKLHQQNKSLHLAPQALRKKAKRNRIITFMSLTQLMAFAVVWVPFWVITFKLFLKQTNSISKALVDIVSYFTFTYTIVNPVVFYLFSKSFRNGLKQILKHS